MKRILILFSIIICGLFASSCDNDSNSVDNVYRAPKLTSFIPKAGYVGGTAIISGSNFSTKMAENEVYINEVKAHIVAATESRLTITLPENPDGTYSIKVISRGNSVEGLKFTYASHSVPVLNVSQIMPSVGYAGDQVTLIGQCFSTNLAENVVSVNGVQAQVKEASATSLKIVMPVNPEGSYVIKVKVGTAETVSPAFKYLHIVVLTTTSIAPSIGKVGDVAVITGEGFGATINDNVVSVNGVQATVTAVTATTLTLKMPANPNGTYAVKVSAGGKTVENTTFTYAEKSYKVTTVAGNGATSGATDGQGEAALFKSPQCLSLASNGDIWIVESGNSAIRKMDSHYNVTTVASKAPLNFPYQGAFNKDGAFYVANKAANNIIKVTSDGRASEFSTTATFKSPMSIFFDASGNMYVSDRDNKAVKKIAPDAKVTSYDMSSLNSGPNCAVVNSKGQIIVGTGGTYQLHMFDTDGLLKNIFGTYGRKPTAETYSDGVAGDLSGATMGATFGLACGAKDEIYITDLTMHTIRVLTPDASGDYTKGTLKTIAGIAGTKGYANGAASSATFTSPAAILASPDGNTIYVAEGHDIRKITLE